MSEQNINKLKENFQTPTSSPKKSYEIYMILLLVVLVIIAGGAYYYFNIYKSTPVLETISIAPEITPVIQAGGIIENLSSSTLPSPTVSEN